LIFVDTSNWVNHLHQADSALVDVHLLAAVVLTPEALLWTEDKRFQAAAAELSLSYL